MRLIPFEPGEFLGRLKKQLEGIFSFKVPDPMAQTNAKISETDKEVIVQWALPGCQDIEVYVDKQSLTLVCTLKYQAQEGDCKISYTGRFKQTLYLPVKVKGETARTSCENGVIEVRIDK